MRKSHILVIATHNHGKITEINSILKDFPIQIKNLKEFGPIPPVEEDGETFDENAYKKASFTARVLGFPALADDSGLMIEALEGAPGVHSARYAGEGATDEQKCERILDQMQGKKNRRAVFQCVISIAMPTGPALTYEGQCKGLITEKPHGSNGFGYDPIFYFPSLKKTFAELPGEEKNRVSHRGNALKELKDEFKKVLIWIDQQMPVQEKHH